MRQGRWWKSQITWLAAFLLGLAMVLGAGAITPAPAQTIFNDVDDYWAGDCIQSLASRNMIEPTPDGLFRPDSPTTWGDYAMLVSRTFPDRITVPALPTSP